MNNIAIKAQTIVHNSSQQVIESSAEMVVAEPNLIGLALLGLVLVGSMILIGVVLSHFNKK